MVAVFIIGVLSSVYLILMPALDDLQAFDRTLVANRALVAANSQKIKRIPDVWRSLDSIEREIKGLKARLVDRDSLAHVLDMISQLAAKFDIRIRSASFAVDSLTADPGGRQSVKLPVVLELSGRFLDFGMFVEHLDRLPFVAGPEAFRIDGKKQESGRLSISIDLAIFVRIENGQGHSGEKNNG